ncbi:glycoside hydrolase family 28 protein [Mangrovimonas sp. YM274]|uniref:glycoside hydrolase family 28 protein n=1 Tax=Mangrovimonas sp. YM274 TaxID=3070660 RepID=UPI0027DBEAD4|nr:glycoside hydrolase family 28 protein [Mangrovimonas sp. YM274]WMI69076.1 glycoside hydrolase family 28 protein [Mangrovimonas sp. YM274]
MNNILKAHLSKLSFSNLVMFVFVMIVCFFSCGEKKQQTVSSTPEGSPWTAMQKIVAEVKAPSFPEATFNILEYGAVADGTADNTEAFRKAIMECSQKGGGKVVVPSGQYLTGPIHLEDNVNLHLEAGAEILFSTNPKDYPLVHTSYEGIELMNYSPLIYAYQKKNIAITGEGTLNGQASNDNWWPWCKKEEYGWKEGMASQRDSLNLPRLMEMGETGVPVAERVFGEGHYLRPTFLEPFECSNVLIQGVKIVNAPFWVIHPIKSNDVIVDGVTVESHGPNNDGCDPEYSKNVIIKNCVFNTGDDCIAIKAGRDAEGRRVAIKSENIVVQNCKMIDGHGGVVIGSEMSAGVSNVYVENCSMDSPHLDRAIRIKTNSRRGGVVDGVYVRNVEVGQVKEAVLRVNLFYATYANQTGEFIPTVKNIYLENMTVKNGGKFGILAKGFPESPVQNVTLKDVVIEQVDSVYSLENVENIKFINTHINGELIKN